VSSDKKLTEKKAKTRKQRVREGTCTDNLFFFVMDMRSAKEEKQIDRI
jgi:hypothetical protein